MGGEADGAAESKVASAFVSGKLLIGGRVGGLGRKMGNIRHLGCYTNRIVESYASQLDS